MDKQIPDLAAIVTPAFTDEFAVRQSAGSEDVRETKQSLFDFFALQKVLATKTSETQVVSSVTETTIFSHTIPAGTLGATDALRLTLPSDRFNNSGSNNTWRWRVKLGASTIIDVTSSAAGSVTYRAFNPLVVLIQALGATNSQAVLLEWLTTGSNIGGTWTTGSGTYSAPNKGWAYNNAAAVDMTADADLVVTVQQSINNALTEWKTFFGFLEHLRAA